MDNLTECLVSTSDFLQGRLRQNFIHNIQEHLKNIPIEDTLIRIQLVEIKKPEPQRIEN